MNIPADIIARVATITSPSTVHAARRLVENDHVSLGELIRIDDLYATSGEARTPAGIEQFELELLPESVYGGCSCDKSGEGFCVHLIAGIMIALTRLAPARAPKASPWKRELDAMLVDPREAVDVSVCLFFAVRKPSPGYYGHQGPREPYLTVRPGIRGSRGTWIKGQRGWSIVDDLPAGHPVTDLFDRLLLPYAAEASNWYYRSRQDWIPLHDLAARDTWELLQALAAHGVAMISDTKAQHPVVLDSEPLRVQATLTRKGTTLTLTARTLRGDQAVTHALWWVGDPPTLAARVDAAGTPDERFTLMRSDQPLARVATRLLHRDAGMAIAPGERDEFERDYLPRLRAEIDVVSPDGSYDIPAVRPASLMLRVAVDGTDLQLSWRWHRPVAWLPDRAHEQAVLRSVRAAAAEQAEMLLPTTPGADGVLTPAPPEKRLGAAAAAIFIGETLPRLAQVEHLQVERVGALPHRAPTDTAPVVDVASHRDGDWFDLEVSVTVGGEQVEFAALLTALTWGDPVFVLPSGAYFPLDGPELAALRDIVAEARALTDRPSSDRIRVSRYQVDLWQELTTLGIIAAAEAEWWLAVQSLGDADRVQPVTPSPQLHAQLRPYQAEGLAWLDFLRRHGLGGILADDMGLGKTLQALAMILLAHDENPAAPPFLVVAPTSVVGNWALECARFAPGLRVVTITATEARRGQRLAVAVADADIVITSYALFRLEAEQYRDLPWSGLIADEAQMMKNPASHTYRAARTLGAPFVLVITGTPLENNLLELWALASLAAPGLLGGKDQFTQFYRHPIEKQHDAERLALLQRRLRPFLLRRTKDLVARDLPPKQEQTLEVALHPQHRKIYDVRFQRERQRVLGLLDDVAANRFEIFRSLMLLRQLALDPELVDAGAAPSAKLELLTDLLRDAAAEGHRVLVLSQFTRFLTRAREHVASAGITSEYLDGSTTRRPEVIARFREGAANAFFVSLKAGGFGLNLVEADYVVLLDPWWNPAVEEQAIDRTHRIGQTRPVFVYRLVSAGTIEHKVIALREAKAELFARVLDGDGQMGSSALDATDIRALLE
ncbi:SNF2-related protein [Microbacterium sp.]|uniref:SNF2-related protein n=1 Tax=Microbacterium sp. TaxID=51671 RepID=UPI003A923C6E